MIATVLIMICVIFCVFLSLIKPYKYWDNFKVPFLKPWPFFGSMSAFIFRQKCIAYWSQDLYNSFNARYIGFYSFFTPILMIKDINLIKQLGIQDFDHFVDHRTMICEELDPILSKNLFRLKGQKWRQMRSILSPGFTSCKLRTTFNLLSKCAQQFSNHFTSISNNEEIITLEMKDAFTRFANDVIATTAFGIECDSFAEKDNEFFRMGKNTCNFGNGRLFKFFGYNISITMMKYLKISLLGKDVYDFFLNLVVTNMKERKEKGIVRHDLIHLLMEAKKEQHEEKMTYEANNNDKMTEEKCNKTFDYLSDEDITAQAILFFIAGFDTVSSALCHLSYELALNPPIQTRLQEEIDETLDECNGHVTYDAILKMKYLDMVVSECLRKWPPVLVVDRVSTDSYTIQAENSTERPVILKKGTPIWFPIYAIHHDPQYYSNPDQFDPDRFSDDNKRNIKPLTYIPFGVGPRNCIGIRFALLEMKTIFFYVLSKFSFLTVETTCIPLKPSKLQFIMHAKDGLYLGLKPRNKIKI